MAEDQKPENQMTPEEKAAAEWEAQMAKEAAGGGAAGEAAKEKAKALSQNEIDSLLGLGGGANKKSGIHSLIDKSTASYERLPMLEVVLDRFVRTLSTTLRNFTSENVDVNIDSITSMRFEDYLNTVPLPALLTVFQAVEWENFGLINVDSSLTYSMVDVLLGGGHGSRPLRVEGRPYTTIEQDIVRNVVNLMLDDLSSAFNALTPATFRFERLESNPRFATITRPVNPIIVASLRIEMEERGGKVDVVIPYATLEPIKDLLTQMFTGEKFGKDTIWESHFSREVASTMVEVEAVIDDKLMSLRELASLRVGKTILMSSSPEDDIFIKCKGIKMLAGKMGCIGDSVAVKVTDVISRKILEEL